MAGSGEAEKTGKPPGTAFGEFGLIPRHIQEGRGGVGVNHRFRVFGSGPVAWIADFWARRKGLLCSRPGGHVFTSPQAQRGESGKASADLPPLTLYVNAV